jgi:hypothetical protein
MICQKCGRVVRPSSVVGRNESITERRYYCSCGHVNKTLEQVVVTWKKTEYKRREPKQEATQAPTTPAMDPIKIKPKRGRKPNKR